jgi:hypothetical protein
MPSYEYYLIEKTVLSVVVEAHNREEADQQVEDMLFSADIDWSMGEMETDYLFNGEIINETL